MTETRGIGVIIGGTNTSIGVLSSDGAIEARRRFETRSRDGFATAMERIASIIRDLCAEVGLDTGHIWGIGVGCTGLVAPDAGTIVTAFNLPTWQGFSVTRALQKKLGVPAFLENNADMAVAGEAFLTDDQSSRNVVLLTLGTGVGGGVIVNGEIYRGSQRTHPEIGHIPVRRNGPMCRCGIRGCLEMVASGTAIGRAGQRIGLSGASEVFHQAALGDSRAKRIIDRAVRYTTVGIWIILHTFLPERIVFGGGIMDAHYDLFEPAIRTTIEKATLVPTQGVSFAKARPGNDAGIVGAAVVALRRIKNKRGGI